MSHSFSPLAEAGAEVLLSQKVKRPYRQRARACARNRSTSIQWPMEEEEGGLRPKGIPLVAPCSYARARARVASLLGRIVLEVSSLGRQTPFK